MCAHGSGPMCPDEAAYGLIWMDIAACRRGGYVLPRLYRGLVVRLADVLGTAGQRGPEAACRVAAVSIFADLVPGIVMTANYSCVGCHYCYSPPGVLVRRGH